MLDINLFRDIESAKLLRESQQKRYADTEIIDAVILLDKEWRAKKQLLDNANADINVLNTEIKKIMKKSKGDKNMIADQLEKKNMLENIVSELKSHVSDAQLQLKNKLLQVGNIVDKSVPINNDEAHNEIVRTWGERKPLDQGKNHHELLFMIDGYEPERGVNIAGARQYFLKGFGVRLQMALINYSIDFLTERSYTPLQVPLMMNKSIMSETAELAQFDEELYKVSGDGGEEKYLIATSEQPISAYHRGEWMDPKQLPLKYAGHSTCFRKEAGSHGRETWGIFRVHQFEKVEQFVICDSNSSWTIHEEMIATSEAFYQSLGIPYRVINIVSGALNNAAAKKYDIEAWFPGYNQYKEVVSCSNCTDYQSRHLKIKCGMNKIVGKKSQDYVHMLNGTLCATTRTICAILETYQTDNGIRIPSVLLPYMGRLPNQNIIPFVKQSKN
jgi:seryl-tRNA synthetase